MSVEDEIKKLGPFTRGQIVLVRGDVDNVDIHEIGLWLASTCDDPPLIVRLPSDVSLEVLDEKEMNEAGWYRSPAFPIPSSTNRETGHGWGKRS